MAFIVPKRPTLNFPPPPLKEMPDERDRFGLPLYFIVLEEDEKRRDRIARTNTLIKDAVEAVIRQVGSIEARRLFRSALATSPKGKQPNTEENARLLAAYDRVVAGRVPLRRAARVAAAEMAKYADVESVANHIRSLVKERKRREAEDEALRERFQPTLLERESRVPETDL